MARIQLELPKPALWAAAGADIVEPSLAQKQLGWVVDDRPPAPWFNWWQRQVHTITRFMFGMVLSNWFRIAQPTSTTVAGLVLFHPSPGNAAPRYYIATTGGGALADLSLNELGAPWSAAGHPDATAPLQPLTGAIDRTRFIAGISGFGTDTRVAYSTTGGAGWTVVSVADGDGAACSAVETNFPATDEILIGTTNGRIRRASNVASAFSAPTTSPPTGQSVLSLRKIGGSTWIALYADGRTYISTDGGDNWTITAQTPFDLLGGATTYTHMAADPNGDDTQLVVTAFDVTGPGALYSNDLGASWTVVGLVALGADAVNVVYSLGNGVWFAGGGGLREVLYAWVSTDDARTWNKIGGTAGSDLGTVVPVGTADILDITCDGASLILGRGGDQLILKSLSVPGVF